MTIEQKTIDLCIKGCLSHASAWNTEQTRRAKIKPLFEFASFPHDNQLVEDMLNQHIIPGLKTDKPQSHGTYKAINKAIKALSGGKYFVQSINSDGQPMKAGNQGKDAKPFDHAVIALVSPDDSQPSFADEFKALLERHEFLTKKGKLVDRDDCETRIANELAKY